MLSFTIMNISHRLAYFFFNNAPHTQLGMGPVNYSNHCCPVIVTIIIEIIVVGLYSFVATAQLVLLTLASIIAIICAIQKKQLLLMPLLLLKKV